APARARVAPRCGWSPGWGLWGWRSGWRHGRRRHRRPPTRPPSSADRGSSRPSSRSLAVALGAPEDGDHFLSLARDAQQLPAAPVARRAVGSYPTFSPLPFGEKGGLFSVALSVALRRPGVTWQSALRSSDFPRRARPAGAPRPSHPTASRGESY